MITCLPSNACCTDRLFSIHNFRSFAINSGSLFFIPRQNKALPNFLSLKLSGNDEQKRLRNSIEIFFSKMPKSTLARQKGPHTVHFCPPKTIHDIMFTATEGVSCASHAHTPHPILFLVSHSCFCQIKNKEPGANLVFRHQKRAIWPSLFNHNHTRRRPTKSALSADCVNNRNNY